MPLPAYGVLIGKPVASRPQQGGHPHWLVMVRPSLPNHPAYRVAVNLSSTEPGAPPEIEYRVIDVAREGSDTLKALVDRLREKGATNSFLTDTGLSLDFVRGGLLGDDRTFKTVSADENPLESDFKDALDAAIASAETDATLLAVFGTGYPINRRTGRSPGTGYTGVDNIHMNQGSPNLTGGGDHYLENGPDQDGGLIFLTPTGATAFFVKFQSQTLDTDDDGNPVNTPLATLNQRLPQVRKLLSASFESDLPAAAPRAVETPPLPVSHEGARAAVIADADGGIAAALGHDGDATAAAAIPQFVFADPDTDDAQGTFEVDDDGGAYKTPFVMQFSKGKTKGPVPTPRSTDPMRLESVVGAAMAGHVVGPDGSETIAFDLIGDSGAPTTSKLPGEKSVGDLLVQLAKAEPPAFMFHVGDVVYYYGEKQFYYGQFADIFRLYPAPIFAIPGNHDGIIWDPSMVSLDAFQQAFCTSVPTRWDGFGGIARTTMTQPGVYFRLDAPLVSIIGLYSNCGESLGWLDDPQYTFFHQQMEDLKAERARTGRAVILAIHHFPRWFEDGKDVVSQRLDALCQDLDFWPDAVVAGHAHLYQRIVRHAPGGRTIPYFVNGAGGYGVSARMAVGGAYVQTAPVGETLQINAEGFLRAKVVKPANGAATLSFAYHSVMQPSGEPVDGYSVEIV